MLMDYLPFAALILLVRISPGLLLSLYAFVREPGLWPPAGKAVILGNWVTFVRSDLLRSLYASL